MMAIIIFGVCVIPIFIMGLMIRQGKWLMLLAGYNTMPAEERDKINKRELGKRAGNLLIRNAVEFTLLGIAIYFKITWLSLVCTAVISVDLLVSIILMNSKINLSAQAAKFNKIGAAVFIILTSLILIGIGIMLYNGEKEPDIIISGEEIQINGMYGLNINIDDISGVSIIDKSMSDIGPGRRTNGYGGIGETLKGNFRSDEFGDIRLFVKSESSPTILIQRSNGKNIYISFKDSEKTKLLYNQLFYETGGLD